MVVSAAVVARRGLPQSNHCGIEMRAQRSALQGLCGTFQHFSDDARRYHTFRLGLISGVPVL